MVHFMLIYVEKAHQLLKFMLGFISSLPQLFSPNMSPQQKRKESEKEKT